jgi:hypothetical protein
MVANPHPIWSLAWYQLPSPFFLISPHSLPPLGPYYITMMTSTISVFLIRNTYNYVSHSAILFKVANYTLIKSNRIPNNVAFVLFRYGGTYPFCPPCMGKCPEAQKRGCSLYEYYWYADILVQFNQIFPMLYHIK